jgi:S-adenosylmethionine/arginine decarboxylase-like enzyme
MDREARLGSAERTDFTECTRSTESTECAAAPEAKDYFIHKEGVRYAGTHLIIDLWNARDLDDRDAIEGALRECVDAAGATLLHVHLHVFEPNGGISGVAVLAESHISVHTWPEQGPRRVRRLHVRQRKPAQGSARAKAPLSARAHAHQRAPPRRSVRRS